MPTNTGLPVADMEKIYESIAIKIIGHIRREIACANICAGRGVVNVIHYPVALHTISTG